MKKILAEKIKSKFNEKSKILNMSMQVAGSEITLFYIESIVDKTLFSASVIAPLQRFASSNQESKQKQIIEQLKNEVFSMFSISESSKPNDILKEILNGMVAIVIDEKALIVPLFEVEKRAVVEPPTSKVIKGPREGFVEDIFTNIGLIRKRLKTPNLQLIDMAIGEQTQTNISIVYLKGIAKDEVLKQILEKLKRINIDGIIDSYYIESFLEDGRIKFFKRVGSTEKPDIFCSKLLEGRIGIFVDGSPIALTLPFILFEDLQSSQDYFTIPMMATFARIMRVFGLIFAVTAPGVYVALQSYNYRILPINFLISILSSIEGLSIPPLLEILVVLFLFEIITEASLQMPNSLAMALSIIGALALGNTAVDAGIISPPSIVVVATSSVALYIIPDEISENRILRILFTLVGGIVGLYGVLITFMILVAYLTSIKSFGVPYFVPYAPDIKRDKKDGFIKQDVQSMNSRPKLLVGKNKIRQKHGGKKV